MDMIVDKLAETILTGENVGFFLGIPVQEETPIGDIDGTNKDFYVNNPPIFPRSCNDLTVKPEDVTVTVDGEAATVSTILFNESEGYAEGFSLASAPDTGDSVKVSYVEEMEPFLAQDVTPDVKQDTKEVSILNESAKITSYAGTTITLKSEQILSKNGLEQFRKLMYYKVGETTGAEQYKLRDKPLNLYGYTVYHVDGETLGRFYFENVKLKPDIPGGKAGDNLSFTLEMTVSDTPTLVIPKV